MATFVQQSLVATPFTLGPPVMSVGTDSVSVTHRCARPWPTRLIVVAPASVQNGGCVAVTRPDATSLGDCSPPRFRSRATTCITRAHTHHTGSAQPNLQPCGDCFSRAACRLTSISGGLAFDGAAHSPLARCASVPAARRAPAVALKLPGHVLCARLGAVASLYTSKDALHLRLNAPRRGILTYAAIRRYPPATLR